MRAMLHQWDLGVVESVVLAPLGGGKTWFVATQEDERLLYWLAANRDAVAI